MSDKLKELKEAECKTCFNKDICTKEECDITKLVDRVYAQALADNAIALKLWKMIKHSIKPNPKDCSGCVFQMEPEGYCRLGIDKWCVEFFGGAK